MVRLYNNYYCTIHNVLLDEIDFSSTVYLPILHFNGVRFLWKIKKLTRERSQALAEVQGFLHERVQGISVVKSFAIEDNEAKNFDKKNTNFLTRALKHTRWNAYSFAAINTVTDIGPIIVIGVGAYLAISDQSQ